MQTGSSPARETRTGHRHGLRSLIYVTVDQGNGGIVLNISHHGMALQTVGAVRLHQQVRLRFDLLYPQVRVDARGEVVWATSTGRCGIRFLDLSPSAVRQIDQWIFGKLLEGISQLSPIKNSALSEPRTTELEPSQWRAQGSIFSSIVDSEPAESAICPDRERGQLDDAAAEDDHLLISPKAVKVISLPRQETIREPTPAQEGELEWLSRPLSGRGLAWTVNTLVVVAAALWFAVVFLLVVGQAPKWPEVMIPGGAVVVATLYWGFFRLLGGGSLGVRLARLLENQREQETLEENRFR
jgi:hypothetical protein